MNCDSPSPNQSRGKGRPATAPLTAANMDAAAFRPANRVHLIARGLHESDELAVVLPNYRTDSVEREYIWKMGLSNLTACGTDPSRNLLVCRPVPHEGDVSERLALSGGTGGRSSSSKGKGLSPRAAKGHEGFECEFQSGFRTSMQPLIKESRYSH